MSITLIAIVFLSYVSIQSFRADIHFEENNSTGPITLENGEKWEKKMGFTPIKPGKDIKVQFLLYRGNQPETYRSLHLRIDVTEKKILMF